MKNFVKWSFCLLVCICLATVRAEARDLTDDILTETETHGKKHLRLMEIPPDEEANHKSMEKEAKCFNNYCVSRVIKGKKHCVIYLLPSGNEFIPCMEWQKGYDDKGRLRTYKAYKIGSKSKIPFASERETGSVDQNGEVLFRDRGIKFEPAYEIDTKYFVEWHENGQVSQICYYENNICQHFDPDGKLIKDCYVERGYGQCSKYNEDTGKWEQGEFWMA